MKIRKLLVIFLIHAALLFTSCANEIPEEFQIELSENMSMNGMDLDDILEQFDYFKLSLYKVSEELNGNGVPNDYEIKFLDQS